MKKVNFVSAGTRSGSAVEFFLFGNGFIALCAAAATLQTQKAVGASDLGFVGLIFCATFTFYNIQRLFLSRGYSSALHSWRHRWIRNNQKRIAVLCLLAFALSIPELLHWTGSAILSFSALALIASGYFLPALEFRARPFLKVFYIAAVWSLATCVAPIVFDVAFPLTHSELLFVEKLTVERFLFILALCLVFDVRDIGVDRTAGLRTVPSVFGVRAAKASAVVATLAFAAVALWRELAFTPNAERHFATGDLSALLGSAVISILVVMAASRHSTEFYYIFVVDSMILVQAVLCLLALR